MKRRVPDGGHADNDDTAAGSGRARAAAGPSSLAEWKKGVDRSTATQAVIERYQQTIWPKPTVIHDVRTNSLYGRRSGAAGVASSLPTPTAASAGARGRSAAPSAAAASSRAPVPAAKSGVSSKPAAPSKVVKAPTGPSPPARPRVAPDSQPFEGMVFALTGALSMLRRKVLELIENGGGEVSSTVTHRVTHLLSADEDTDSAKAVSARKKGITVVNEAWFNRALQGRGATGKGKPAGRSGVAPMEVDDNDGDDAEDVAAEQDDQPADDEEAGGGGGGGDGGGDGDGGGAEPVPLNSLPEGAVHKIEGSRGNYEIRHRAGVYYCTCTAWKFAGGSTDRRTCKHLKEFLGLAYDAWRTGSAGAGDDDADDDGDAKGKSKGKRGASGGATGVRAAGGKPKLLLADKWDEKMDLSGWWISEKLDGVRAFWDGTNFVSRLGNVFPAPAWFKRALPRDITLDGELFGGRKQFQKTVGIVKTSGDHSERAGVGGWRTVTYQMFDVPSKKDQPFEERMAYAKELVKQIQRDIASTGGSGGPAGAGAVLSRTASLSSGVGHVQWLEQVKCRDPAHLQELLKDVLAKGGEGLIARKPKSSYITSRSSTCLKIKTFSDDEAEVIGYIAGKGKYAKAKCGSLQVRLANGLTFAVGSGLTDAERNNPPKIGSIITFKYQELTDAGIPRFPSFIGVRIDAAWPPARK